MPFNIQNPYIGKEFERALLKHSGRIIQNQTIGN